MKEEQYKLLVSQIASLIDGERDFVVPVFGNDGKVMAVLDIDSERLATFDDTDRKYLEEICQRIRLSIR